MKKILCLIMVTVLALAFVGCSKGGSSKSQYIGEWHVESIEVEGNSMEWDEANGAMIMKVEEGGKASLSITGGGENGINETEVKWEEVDGELVVDDGTSKLKGTIKDKKLELDSNGTKLVLKKK